MLSRDIPLFKLDLSGKNPDNYMGPEYYRRTDTENDIVFILRSGPFYTASLQLTDTEGNDLVEDEDYEIFGIASALTAFAKDKEVGMMIKIINPKLTEWFASYQVMGHFSALNQDLVNLVEGAINDDRPLYYKNIKNKPLWFDPKLHQHDIRYDVHSFGDLIDIIQRIPDIKRQRKNPITFGVEQFYDTITSHIEAYETMLLDYIKKHDSDNASPLTNSHGLTASQVGLGNVDNFSTATLLDVLDGFRQDLHLTAEMVKRVLDQQPDVNKTLYPSGILPILRYGNNSFIPSPIRGSFEGMGGTDFYMGVNYEPNGQLLTLCNRSDGRVNALYFMQYIKNPDPNGIDDFVWEYTAYAYTHQTADSEGVTLDRVLRGSDGKFLIVGGTDRDGKDVWYYTLGNGSFDPLKHVLARVPEGISITRASMIFTGGFPDRILVFTRQTSGKTIGLSGEYRNLVYDTPDNSSSFGDIDFSCGFIGLWGYEYDIKNKKWSKIEFTYTQAGRSELVTSRFWAPFKIVVEPISVDRPRADGVTTGYGIGSSQYYFSTLITLWNMRDWYEFCLGFYNEINEKSYIKFSFSAYGQDRRSANFEGGSNSIGLIFSDRTVKEDGIVNYTLENRKGMNELYIFNTAVAGARTYEAGVTDSAGNLYKGNAVPLSEWASGGYQGPKTIVLLNREHYFSFGSNSYGSFPLAIEYRNFRNLSNVNDNERWVDTRFDVDGSLDWNGSLAPGYNNAYNETNPIGLSIGMHSVFWAPLNLYDVNTFGSISYGYNGTQQVMLFRKQSVLNQNGCAVPPSRNYQLYGKNVVGYDLNNEVYEITSSPFYCYSTNIFWDAADNRRSDYIKHLAGHQGVRPIAGNAYDITASTATTQFHIEWDIRSGEKNGKKTYEFFPTKTIEMKDILNNVLIPAVVNGSKTLSPNENYLFNNALATYRIGFTHLRSNKYEQLLIFACLGFSETTDYVDVFSVAFNLTGGSPDSDGIWQNAQATIVGNVTKSGYAKAVSSVMVDYRKDDAKFRASHHFSQTQSRDLVKQLENGMSFVNLQWSMQVNVVSNISKAGTAYLVSEEGIVGAAAQTQYWTPGEYRIFHHPYYGMVNRQDARRVTGASQSGWRYQQNPTDINQAINIGLKPDDTLYLGDSNYMDGAFTIIFSTAQKGIQNGNRFSLPTSQRNLNEVTSDPRNKTFYIYLDYNENGAYYNISLTPQAETATRALLSIVKTNNESIYEIVNYNVFTMDGIRISIQKKGSVIPAATGSINEAGQLKGWVTKNRS